HRVVCVAVQELSELGGAGENVAEIARKRFEYVDGAVLRWLVPVGVDRIGRQRRSVLRGIGTARGLVGARHETEYVVDGRGAAGQSGRGGAVGAVDGGHDRD